MPSALEHAVLRTILYADVFNFAPDAREIHHFLIYDEAASFEAVEQAITALSVPSGPLLQRDGYVCLAARPELIALRREREAASAALLPVARRYARLLASLPFIRMVALTGALAVRNAAGPDDDLDFLLVTSPGRVWLARAFSIILVRLARARGAAICPNYVLAETALRQERLDLFIAHELAQMLPAYGSPIYDRMRAENRWSARYLPNATAPFADVKWPQPGRLATGLKRVAEWLLGGRLGDALEDWEQRRKLRRFAVELQSPDGDARLDSDHVKGHFNDHGQRVLRAYADRLVAYDCAEEPAAAD